MSDHEFQYIGRGLYSLPEAARLTGIPTLRIRRWMEGYHFRPQGGRRRHSRAIVARGFGRDAGELALSFAQLIELRFLDAFLERGVSMQEIRLASEHARHLVQSDFPFSNKKFKTDGKRIIAEIIDAEGDVQLLSLVKRQFEISKVVSPMLFAGIDFDQFDQPDRWWPLNRSRGVVIDPHRSFGAPIVDRGGVPTNVLAASMKAERSMSRVARLYEVSPRAVRNAMEFERTLVA